MSNRLDMAKELINKGDFDIAKKLLEKETDLKGLYLLSLLHRYDDEYKQEKEVVDRALRVDTENVYMKERKAWHDLPLFDQVVPRQPLHLPRDPKTIPSAEVLENLCFVTGADSNYFQLMVECIESIKATQLYKDVPVCVLDCGLTEEEKGYLTEKLNIKNIKDPGWDIPNPLQNNGFKAMTARPFLYKHFPGYRYYFWIDADAWIQDERSVDRFINFSCQYGIGVAGDPGYPHPKDNMKFLDYQGGCNTGIISTQLFDAELFANTPFIAAGAFCIDANSGIYKKWSEYFNQNIAACGFHFHTEQSSLNVVVGTEKIPEVLSTYDSVHIAKYAHSLPIYRDGLLCSHKEKYIFGIIQLTLIDKQNGYYKNTRAIDDQTGEVLTVPYHYRVWLWQDKEQIQSMLEEVAK